MRKNIHLSITIVILLLSLASMVLAQNIDKIYSRPAEYGLSKFWKWIADFSDIKKSYALVIGVSDYSNGFTKIESPIYDANRVKDFLLKEARFDKVYLLTNSSVTLERINYLMEEVFPDLVRENDRFLFYFSGHGTQRKIGNAQHGYLVTPNAGQNEFGKMISMNQINYWDSLLKPKRHVLFVLDACFSGLAGLEIKSKLEDKKLKRLSQYAHHLITAGSADERSVASLQRWGGSLFTDAFLQGASGRADTENADYGRDGIISLKELMDYLGKRIDEESLKIPGLKMSSQMSRLQPATEGEFFFFDKSKKDFIPYRELEWQYGGPIESYGPEPDISRVPRHLVKKFLSVKNMIEMLKLKDPPVFMIVLFKYYIEGVEYRASGLTVSQGHTTNLQQTLTGFECETYFKPHMLHKEAVEGKEPLPNGTIPVKMKVELENIYIIAGRDSDGKQINLFD